ncbi:MFS transporter [Novipirellula artificiosorum]|uniref:Major Facilitator Superfamily protein n=1 Tax=Novipirellula artificiosorum TaxID=2528016 RepID=A0A5C6DRD1_9BACT|nr:MFS transporter [Novipirellula artificiosorum]TWU39400.1 Major Facilitator Superfamily protein [Novipirellula artificiosorum]
MEKNLKLYPYFQACASLHFWLPVFFLYFQSVLTVREVLILETIYYWSVVALEVPSGYFSDRIGRRPTLQIAAVAWTAAYLLFATTASFMWFAFAQIFLAVGMSFRSGTDSSILYDSLQTLDRSDEVGEYEGVGQSYGFYATAAACLAGGILAGFDLRVAYLLSAIGSVLTLWIVWRMTEPPRYRAETELTFTNQLVRCVAQLKHPTLRWVSVFVVAITVFNHVPYEFFQSYLDILIQRYGFADPGTYAMTPLVASLHVAVTMLIAGWASRRSMAVCEKLGAKWTLIASMLLQAGLIALMAIWVHPVIAVLLLLRSTPRGLMTPVINATVHPHLSSDMRATFLSLQSFAGRLCFGGALLMTSFFTAGIEKMTAENLFSILAVYAIGSLVVLLILSATNPAIKQSVMNEDDEQPRL